MLAALVGAQLAAGLLLRGAWDLWAQSAVLLALIAGLALWLSLRAPRADACRCRPRAPPPGPRRCARSRSFPRASAPCPSTRCRRGPRPRPDCGSFRRRRLLSRARPRPRRAGRARGGLDSRPARRLSAPPRRRTRPASTLLNQNVFAGAILLLLPFAARRGDGPLAAGLLLCLWWTHSVGAWLGLVGGADFEPARGRAVRVLGRRRGGFAGLVAGYAKLQSPEVLHRWDWWAAAWRMAADAPWLGLGPGLLRVRASVLRRRAAGALIRCSPTSISWRPRPSAAGRICCCGWAGSSPCCAAPRPASVSAPSRRWLTGSSITR